jgi:gliding motility associated protien GldN
MKKSIVLIVFLLLANSFTLLAQVTKSDSSASKTDTTKKATPAAVNKAVDKKAADKALKAANQKRMADSIANIKAIKIALEKHKADSISLAKESKNALEKHKADSISLAKASKNALEKHKADSLSAAKISKNNLDKHLADSISAAKKAGIALQKSKKDSITSKKATKVTTKAAPTDTTRLVNAKSTPDTAKAAKTNLANTKSTPDTATKAVKTNMANKASQPLSTENKTAVVTPPPTKKDSTSTPGLAQKINRADTTIAAKKGNSKKDKKLAAKKSASDTTLSGKVLSAKVKPVKAKSAKQLKKEAEKNDVNRLSAKDLVKMAFTKIGSDSSFRNIKRADISFTNARPLPLYEPNPTNIKFYHRYWRDIDLQDPLNKKFASYHADLINGLLDAIRKNQITAYNPAADPINNPTGDAFTVPIAYNELMAGLSDTALVNILDKDGNITGTKSVPNPFTPDKISGYRIKEDVFYDKTKSKTVTRIIGIAPLVKITLSSGEVMSIQPLCWLKFKDCRTVLVTIDVDPTKKIGDSMDDVFLQHRFYGRIVQESNPDGLRIKDYKTELPDQITEAQRIEKKVAVFKNGTWSYTMLSESPAPAPGSVKTTTKNQKNNTKTPPIPKTAQPQQN